MLFSNNHNNMLLKNKTLQIVLLFVVVLILLLGFYFLGSYYSNIRYCEPIKIYFNKSSIDFEKINLYALTPSNKKENLNKDEANSCFYAYYGFRKNIFIELPDELIYSIKFDLKIGNKNFDIKRHNLSKINSGLYVLNPENYPKINFLKVIKSIFYWQITQVFLNVLFAIFSIISILYFRKKIIYLVKKILSGSLYFTLFFKKRAMFLFFKINIELLKVGKKNVFKTKKYFKLLLNKKKQIINSSLTKKKNNKLNINFLKSNAIVVFRVLINKNSYSFIDKSKYRLLIFLILFISYSLSLYKKDIFNEKVIINMDARDYQTIAVNFAKGHGIHKMGLIEPYDVYKFDTIAVKKAFWLSTAFRLTKMFSGHFAFFRNPGYPFLLGVCYKIFGIQPEIAMKIQFFILIFIIAFLPILGYLLWKKKGFFAGLIAGFLFIDNNFYGMISNLMTEWLQIITILFIVLSAIYYVKKKNYLSAIILGLLFGLSFLVKLSLLPLPFIFFAYQFYLFIRKRDKKILSLNLIIFIIYISIAGSWTIYASSRVKEMKQEWESNKKVLSNKHLSNSVKIKFFNNHLPFLSEHLKRDSIYNIKAIENKTLRYDTISSATSYSFFLINDLLSTQQLLCFYEQYIAGQSNIFLFVSYPDNSVMSANNEFVRYKENKIINTITIRQKNTGEDCLHPEWFELSYSFYNNDNMKSSSPFARVINFYKKAPKYFLINIYVKIISVFRTNPYINLFFLLFIVSFIISFVKGKTIIKGKTLVLYPILTPILLIPFFGSLSYSVSFIILISFIILLCVKIIKNTNVLTPLIPEIIYLIFFNFLLLMMFFAAPRYIEPIEYIIILLSIYYLVLYLCRMFHDFRDLYFLKDNYIKSLINKETIIAKIYQMKLGVEKVLSYRSNRIFICLVLGIVYFAVFNKIGPDKWNDKPYVYRRVEGKWDNKVYFGYNSAEYQSMGVNFAKGHGFQRYGAMEDYSVYKFDTNNVFFPPKPIFKMFLKYPGIIDVWRTPGYGLFLGVVYKIAGINPWVVKTIQLIMLVFIASFLPILAYLILKTKGFISALFAGFFFLMYNYKMAGAIEAEVMVAFFVFFQILIYYYFEKKKIWYTALLAGLYTAACLLIKEIFLPPLILYVAYLLFNSLVKKKFKDLKYISIFIIASILPVLPWSYFASSNRNNLKLNEKEFSYNLLSDTAKPIMQKPNIQYSVDNDEYSTLMVYKYAFVMDKTPIFLSSFIKNQLLNVHNEYLSNAYQMQWQYIKTSFYLNDNLSDYPDIIRVVNFYIRNPQYFLRNLYDKLIIGFKFIFIFWLMLVALILDNLNKSIKKIKPLLYILFAVIFVAFILIIHYQLFFIILIFTIISILYGYIYKRQTFFHNMPTIINLYIICYLLLSFAVTIYERNVQGICFIYYLCFFYLLLINIMYAINILYRPIKNSLNTDYVEKNIVN